MGSQKEFIAPKTTLDKIANDANNYTNKYDTRAYNNDIAAAYIAGATAVSERAQKMSDALEKIIEMNRHHALDQYGDSEKAESWGCVIIARKALQQWNAGKEVEEPK